MSLHSKHFSRQLTKSRNSSYVWACLIFFMIQGGNFQQEHHRSDVVSFSVNHMWFQFITRLKMLTLITWLRYTVCQIPLFYLSFFSFVISKWLWENTFSPWKFLVHTKPFSLHVNFSIPIILLVSFLPKGRKVFLSLIFMHSFILVWAHEFLLESESYSLS